MMKRPMWLLLGLVLHGTVVAETYTYSGSLYTAAQGVYTTSMRITGSFSTANPLPPNMPLTNIGPHGNGAAQSWLFFDGVNYLTEANSTEYRNDPSNFAVATDADGNISKRQIVLLSPLPPHTVGQQINLIHISDHYDQGISQVGCDTLSADTCVDLGGGSAGKSIVHRAPGTFSIAASPPASIPTLDTYGLLLLALVLVAASLWFIG